MDTANEIRIQTDKGVLRASVMPDNSGIKTEFLDNEVSEDTVGAPGVALVFDEKGISQKSYQYGSNSAYKTERIAVLDDKSGFSYDEDDEETLEDYQKRFMIYLYDKDTWDYTPVKAYNRLAHAVERARQLASGSDIDAAIDWIEIQCENSHVVAVISPPDGAIEYRIDLLPAHEYPYIYNCVYPMVANQDSNWVNPDKTALIADFINNSNANLACVKCSEYVFERTMHDVMNKFPSHQLLLVNQPVSLETSAVLSELSKFIKTQTKPCLICFVNTDSYLPGESEKPISNNLAADFLSRILKELSTNHKVLISQTDELFKLVPDFKSETENIVLA